MKDWNHQMMLQRYQFLLASTNIISIKDYLTSVASSDLVGMTLSIYMDIDYMLYQSEKVIKNFHSLVIDVKGKGFKYIYLHLDNNYVYAKIITMFK